MVNGKTRQKLKSCLLRYLLLKQTKLSQTVQWLSALILFNKIMNQSQRLIFRSNIQVLLRPQCRTVSKIKLPCDKIGPADPISNLRHIRYAVRANETFSEQKLRKHREELQTWNEVFWTKHNLSFVQKKNKYIESELSKKGLKNDEMLSAEEISVFYKDFLDKNWKTHLKYLIEWYKKNFYVTYLHFRVNIEKIFQKR